MLQEFTSEIEKTARSVVNDIHTALPGEIVAFDGGMASVRPVGRYVTSDGIKLDYPIITEVPVVFPYCQSVEAGIAFPVKKGDSCLIIISEVELDAWRSGAEATGSLRFDLSSAIAIPGLLKAGCDIMKSAAANNAVIVKAGSTELAVSTGGVSITGSLTVTGDVTAGSVSLSSHIHKDSRGGSTTAPL